MIGEREARIQAAVALLKGEGVEEGPRKSGRGDCSRKTVRGVGRGRWPRRCLFAMALLCLVVAITAQSALAATTVALWHMNETSGTIMQDADGDHDGTVHSVSLGLPGFAGTAYGFNGKSSYVSVPSANDLNPGTQNVTLSIHLKTTGTAPAAPADWDLIRKGDFHSPGPWNEFKMELQQNGQISCGFDGTTASKLDNHTELQAGPKVNDGQWHTAQCVKTATAIEVVVDGHAFSKQAKLGSISNTLPVVIGAHPGADWYNGALDEASLQFG